MHRRNFIKNTGFIGGGLTLMGSHAFAKHFAGAEEPWFDKSMRWAQLAFVENDPGRYDPFLISRVETFCISRKI